MSTPFKAGTLIKAVEENFLVRIVETPQHRFSMLYVEPGSTHMVLSVVPISDSLYVLTLLTPYGEAQCAHPLDVMLRRFKKV